MNINFKGIYNAKVLTSYNKYAPKFNELGKDENILYIKCYLKNDEQGDHALEYYNTISKSDCLKDFIKPFYYCKVFLGIEKSNNKKEYGYSISLDGEKIDQQDEKSIFGILTFLCAMTKDLISLQSKTNPENVKYYELSNKVLDKVAKRALKG